MIRIYILVFILTGLHGFTQTHKIDSLLHALKSAKEDTNKVNTLNGLSFKLEALSKVDSSIACANTALALAEKLNFKKGIALACDNIGYGYYDLGEYSKALDYDNKALVTAKEDGDVEEQSNVLSNMGIVYKHKGDFVKAIDCFQQGLKISEDLGNKRSQASNLGNLGNVYSDQGDYPKALDYYLKTLKMAEESGNKRVQEGILANIGLIHYEQNDTAKALEYDLRALKMAEELGNKSGIARNLGNIGLLYKDQGNSTKAMDCFQKAMKIAEELGDKSRVALNLGSIGLVYEEQDNYAEAFECEMKALKMNQEIGNKNYEAINLGNLGTLDTKYGKFKDAEAYLKKAIVLDSSIGDLNNLRLFEEAISQLYDTIGRYKPALEYYKKAMVLKDTLFNIDKNKALTRKELTYEFDKKQAAEKAEQDKKDALAESDKRKQTIIIWSTIGGLLLVLVFAGFIFRSLRITRKQKQVIEIKNKETEEQKKVIEEKNKDIVDSINYAKRLQDAILPPLNLIKQTLPESFVLYKPKDIVAGDFYWMEVASLPSKGGFKESSSSKNTNLVSIPPLEGGEAVVLIAAADCTGHGVPGALVSVVCSNALNRTVKEFKITETGKILDKVRELVLETFEKSEDNVQDGMDISLCSIKASLPSKGGLNKTGSEISTLGSGGAIEVQWAGANNSLLYVQSGEIKEINPDKQPIGKTDNPKPFTTHTFTIPAIRPEADGGATLYLFTDGYADQFGGAKGKKFKYAQLQEKLLAISHQPLAEQKNILEQTFNEWKGNLEQVDDVLIIGIKV